MLVAAPLRIWGGEFTRKRILAGKSLPLYTTLRVSASYRHHQPSFHPYLPRDFLSQAPHWGVCPNNCRLVILGTGPKSLKYCVARRLRPIPRCDHQISLSYHWLAHLCPMEVQSRQWRLEGIARGSVGMPLGIPAQRYTFGINELSKYVGESGLACRYSMFSC